MKNKQFNIQEEWNFIAIETVKKAPNNLLSAPWVTNRELLLKAQVLLGKIEYESRSAATKLNLINQYLLIVRIYSQNLNGQLN